MGNDPELLASDVLMCTEPFIFCLFFIPFGKAVFAYLGQTIAAYVPVA